MHAKLEHKNKYIKYSAKKHNTLFHSQQPTWEIRKKDPFKA